MTVFSPSQPTTSEKRRLSSCTLGKQLDVGFYAFALLASGSLEILAFASSITLVVFYAIARLLWCA